MLPDPEVRLCSFHHVCWNTCSWRLNRHVRSTSILRPPCYKETQATWGGHMVTYRSSRWQPQLSPAFDLSQTNCQTCKESEMIINFSCQVIPSRLSVFSWGHICSRAETGHIPCAVPKVKRYLDKRPATLMLKAKILLSRVDKLNQPHL